MTGGKLKFCAQKQSRNVPSESRPLENQRRTLVIQLRGGKSKGAEVARRRAERSAYDEHLPSFEPRRQTFDPKPNAYFSPTVIVD